MLKWITLRLTILFKSLTHFASSARDLMLKWSSFEKKLMVAFTPWSQWRRNTLSRRTSKSEFSKKSEFSPKSSILSWFKCIAHFKIRKNYFYCCSIAREVNCSGYLPKRKGSLRIRQGSTQLRSFLLWSTYTHKTSSTESKFKFIQSQTLKHPHR